jgi:hypothetical protein
LKEIPFSGHPGAYVRLRGRNDYVREYCALISPGSDNSILPKVDAYRLGYGEAARGDRVTQPPNLLRGLTYNGYWEGMLVNMKEVTLAGVSVQDVPFVAFDLPQASSFDVVLGWPLLRLVGVEIDLHRGLLRLRSDTARDGGASA